MVPGAPGLIQVPDLVLASASPQRKAILAQLGIGADVVPSDAEELSQGDPAAVALENARRKALVVAASRPGATVLGCDTLVALDGRIYGKPADEEEARRTLAALSGRTHQVVSGLVLARGGALLEAVEVTEVTFGEVPVEAYVAAGEWRGRAGGYAIQGQGAWFVERIAGDYLNVVGLPVPALRRLLAGAAQTGVRGAGA